MGLMLCACDMGCISELGLVEAIHSLKQQILMTKKPAPVCWGMPANSWGQDIRAGQRSLQVQGRQR